MAAPAGQRTAPAARAVTGVEALLFGAVAAVVAWEALLWTGPFAAGQDAAPAWWYLPPAAVMLAALLAAWPRRAQLRPGAVVALSALLSVAFLAVHAVAGGPRDQDIVRVYEGFGRQLRAGGGLPAAEYPPLALLVFAAAGAVGPVRVALPLLLLPLLLAAWWALARLRPDGPWLAATAALWPTLVPFWEVKYDALPAALTVLGLVAAQRRAWGRAGVLLGLGAAAKWFPALGLPPLVVALARRRDPGGLLRLTAGAAAAVAACTLPFAGQPQALAFPYRFHAARGVNAESLPYLALRLAGLADRPARAWFEATVPPWASEAALAVLAGALLALLVAAWRRPEAAVLLAAASVAAFLLGNRVFSPQFLLPLAALWALGLALRAGAGRRGPALAVLLAVAANANWAVWPLASPAWVALGWLMFAAALAASVLAFAPARPQDERVTPS